ncbi:MAG TPA: YfiR family protein [Steroidobacteraceae bacterium]|nr:YfiR family protein [Steroidobacteraceae bacterium]
MQHRADRTRGRSRMFRTLVVLCMLCGYAAVNSGHTLETYPEDAVKAAFVYRFAAYVKWPEDSLPPDRFTIAVLGAGDVAANLHALTSGRTLLGRPVQVRQVASIHQADDAQILFVGNDRHTNLHALRSALAGRATLVVSDAEDGLNWGSAINLLLVEHRVRFEISVPAAEQAGLKISSDLLTLAVEVRQ